MSTLTYPEGKIYPNSLITHEGSTYALASVNGQKRLLVQGDPGNFEGRNENGTLVCERSAHNAATLRTRLDWLQPVPLGRATSFGFGDRLGLATPGHVQSLRSAAASHVAPIFAQQSVRENERTGRSPQEVVDDATWGVFQEGWRAPWGADADHVKKIDDLAPFVKAGYTFFTIDPSDYVDNGAQTDSIDTLNAKIANFPWTQWGRTYQNLQNAYGGSLQIGNLNLTFDEETLLRAVVKYGRAVLHTAAVAAALDEQMGGKRVDLEMSVDETDTPTSIHEHYFIANELLLRNLPVVSLAPRFVGKFQKGVDYIGDLAEFEADLRKQMAILHHFDAYKISVHTGSDKFSIYPVVSSHAKGYVHVKTAGTSYLEALRVAACHEPVLFRRCLDLAHERFAVDKKSYFLDCRPELVPTSGELTDTQLPQLLADESFDARQLLHVTFGSNLDTFGDELALLLTNQEDAYRQFLERHFTRHLKPLE